MRFTTRQETLAGKFYIEAPAEMSSVEQYRDACAKAEKTVDEITKSLGALAPLFIKWR